MDKPLFSRKIVDADSIEWAVFEAGAAGRKSLVFDCAHSFRRVREYPADWSRLSPTDLLALKEHL